MDLEKSLPLAEGAVDAEQSGLAREGDNKKCLNCDTPLTGPYCTNCGQKDLPARQKLGDLLLNFISSFWSFESKFLRTGKYLLFKPGFLAQEYNVGKRERYYHPARLYVFVSFIFFLLFTTLPDSETKAVKTTKPGDLAYSGQGTSFNISGDYKTKEQYDSAQNALPPEKRHGKFARTIQYRAIELNQKYENRGDDFIRDFKLAFTANFPKVFFLLLPIFALLLKCLYIRRDYYYAEHLVFSIYYYNFFFLAGSVSMLAGLLPWLEWINYIITFWILLYLLLGMKKMYRQTWGKTIAKYVIFGSVFSLCVGIGLAINVAIIFMYI